MSRLSPEVERRRRLVTRALPLGLVALVAFVLGAIVGVPGSPAKEAATSFGEAWEARDYGAMYRELNETSRESVSLAQFTASYREAAEVSTLRRLEASPPEEPRESEGETVVPLPLRLSMVAFGKLEPELLLPWADGGIAWNPTLVFPGLRSGERLESQIELAPRAPILAADGSELAAGPANERERPLGSAAADITGEIGEPSEEDAERLAKQGFTPETPVGISGLERAFNARLAGKPGGSLLAVSGEGASVRVLAQAEPREGAPVKTTIHPEIQEAAVAALAGRFGGVAVLDARNGDVRALAGQAFSAPQPPGSTFKIVTTAAALQKKVVKLDDEFEYGEGINVGGRFIFNANGEICGGTFVQAFAHSCNAVFAPLGPKVGNDDLVATAERFGFNEPPSLYAPRYLREADPPESTIPTEIPTEIELGVSAIGQGEVQATPLEMASVAQTIANDGVRMPTSIVNNKKLRPHAKPVRVVSKEIAEQISDLMVSVVVEGTGTAGAIAEAQVAGKTGTAELGPKEGQENEENPIQIKDAWFTAFAPAEKPRLAVGVLLIEAEASGGEVAAPLAAEVLSAGI